MLNVRVAPISNMADNNPLNNSSDRPTYCDTSALSPSKIGPEENWPEKVLAALKDSAPPEPIRLACMSPVPTKPHFFEEEFHGKLTREQVNELLLGGTTNPANGRFLVRESLSAPGDYSLSLTYGSKISHYRLFYSGGKYSTSKDASEKKYEKLVELVIDILEMLRYVEGAQVAEKKDKKSSEKTKSHCFKLHHYKQPKWCDICGKFMWGLKGQGMRCEVCGMNVHQKCTKDAKKECKPPQPNEKAKASKKLSNAGLVQRNSITVDSFRTQCDYQEGCVRFLNYLNVPVSLFDVNALNPCYCDHCCQEVETPLYKKGDPPREYSMPLGWCRVQFSAAENVPMEASSVWNMAFMSLSAQNIVEVLESKFGGDADSSGDEMPKPLTKFTPSIICADLDSPVTKYTDPDTEERRAGQVVLQVYIQPYSYRLMGRAGSKEEIDPFFKKETIYWVTNQLSYVVPFALLVKTMDATYLQL